MSAQDSTPDAVDLQVVFSAARHRFAVPYEHVLRMVTPPTAVPVPNTHPALRGVINLRGDVLGLVCMRTLLGLPDMTQENAALSAELDLREADHRYWLSELRAAVDENRPFTLATDPHQCGFGRWFDNYVAPTEHLAALVARFDRPHQRIHAIAQQVDDLRRRGHHEEALKAIRHGEEGDLARLVREFDDVREAVASWDRQIAIVLSPPNQTPVALLVDTVESVQALQRVEEGGSEDDRAPFIAGLARDPAGQLVNRIELDALYRSIQS